MPEKAEPVISHGRCSFWWPLFGYHNSASYESINLFLSWPTDLHLVCHPIKCFSALQMRHDLET